MARWRSWLFSGNSKSVKNMCSVRHKPDTLRAELDGLARVLRRVRVSAYAQPANVVGPPHDGLIRFRELRSHER